MIGLFKNAVANSVGVTPVTIYTAPIGLTSIVIELDVANVKVTGVQADVIINRVEAPGVSAYLAKNIPIPEGSTAKVVTNQKVVLQPGDSISVNASEADAVDVIASIIEDVNTIV